MVKSIPASARTESVSRSTAVSGSHMPCGLVTEAMLKIGDPQATWVTLSWYEASGKMVWL